MAASLVAGTRVTRMHWVPRRWAPCIIERARCLCPLGAATRKASSASTCASDTFAGESCDDDIGPQRWRRDRARWLGREDPGTPALAKILSSRATYSRSGFSSLMPTFVLSDRSLERLLLGEVTGARLPLAAVVTALARRWSAAAEGPPDSRATAAHTATWSQTSSARSSSSRGRRRGRPRGY
eukprot:TRINITY_DN57956_c0_g1_i1.p1 TRINITY_DN57956_c0_g1~~TRINITY_DN57956_c0_g1_i1.p1  ORF type:complete len:200 (-),score=24.41 TRINITY_DN57956_c0_g1_i1:33-581(-)